MTGSEGKHSREASNRSGAGVQRVVSSEELGGGARGKHISPFSREDYRKKGVGRTSNRQYRAKDASPIPQVGGGRPGGR
eukprot:13123603-Heterocapsa_arctica.AAC.1